jgi:SAM-dependent methyltransferase
MLTEKQAFQIVLDMFANVGAIQSGYEARDFALFLSDKKITNILELGTGSGGMCYLMSKVCRPSLMITTDMPWNARDPKLPDNWDQRFRLHLPHVIELIGDIHSDKMKLDIIDVLTAKGNYRKGGDPFDGDTVVCQDYRRDLDLIFQDSDHSKNGSMQDFKDYSPLLKKGGYFCFHDVLNGHGTQKTYEELSKHYPHWEFAEQGNLFGIGALQL